MKPVPERLRLVKYALLLFLFGAALFGSQIDFAFDPDELRRAFEDWNVLIYREGWQSKDCESARAVASLVARKP